MVICIFWCAAPPWWRRCYTFMCLRLSPSGTKWLLPAPNPFPPTTSAIICSPGWQLLPFIPSIARLLGLNDMLFQRSCSNDIITPAQAPSYHSGMDDPLGADLLQNNLISLPGRVSDRSVVEFRCILMVLNLSISRLRQAQNAALACDFLVASCESVEAEYHWRTVLCFSHAAPCTVLLLLQATGLTPPCSLGELTQ